jgi:hypothetical protein
MFLICHMYITYICRMYFAINVFYQCCDSFCKNGSYDTLSLVVLGSEIRAWGTRNEILLFHTSPWNQGDQMSSRKNWPKCGPINFCLNYLHNR